jgi:RNA polymerase sigma-70 factor (ECF subfamily)
MASPESDAQWAVIVPQAQRGDAAARDAVYAAFAPVVHAIVLGHVGPALAADTSQEVFCNVFASLKSLRDPEALPGFVCAAARNAAFDVLRRRQRTPAAEPVEHLEACDPSPAATAEQRELAERALACIRALPEAYRETLLLRLVGGLSGQEIAARTGLTHGSVRVNLTRGMAMLRPLLQEAGLP